MGRELKRVPLDFDWPLDVTWSGYVRPEALIVQTVCGRCAGTGTLRRVPNSAAVDCPDCDGHGETWPSPEAKDAYDEWQMTGPPEGPGYQIWETISEGSPISAVFATPEALAAHMAKTRYGADQGTSYEKWLAFITGPAWSPTFLIIGGVPRFGVEAIGDLAD